MSLDDSISLALEAIYEATDNKSAVNNVEIAVIKKDTQKYEKLSQDKVQEYIDSLIAKKEEEAKAEEESLEAEEEEEEASENEEIEEAEEEEEKE